MFFNPSLVSANPLSGMSAKLGISLESCLLAILICKPLSPGITHPYIDKKKKSSHPHRLWFRRSPPAQRLSSHRNYSSLLSIRSDFYHRDILKYAMTKSANALSTNLFSSLRHSGVCTRSLVSLTLSIHSFQKL